MKFDCPRLGRELQLHFNTGQGSLSARYGELGCGCPRGKSGETLCARAHCGTGCYGAVDQYKTRRRGRLSVVEAEGSGRAPYRSVADEQRKNGQTPAGKASESDSRPPTLVRVTAPYCRSQLGQSKSKIASSSWLLSPRSSRRLPTHGAATHCSRLLRRLRSHWR